MKSTLVLIGTHAENVAEVLQNKLNWKRNNIYTPVKQLCSKLFPVDSEEKATNLLLQSIRGIDYTALVKLAIKDRSKIKVLVDDHEEYELEKQIITGVAFIPELDCLDKESTLVVEVGADHNHFIPKDRIDLTIAYPGFINDTINLIHEHLNR